MSNLRGVPGSTRVTLLWQNPDDARCGATVIRRSIIAPPSLPNDGILISGSAPHPQAFIDTGATQGEIYYYTVFFVDQTQNFHRGQSVAVRTGVDSDGDGLADSYETSVAYPTTQSSLANNTDSDGDGATDYDEVVNGTDPTNGDTTAPTVTAFTRTSTSPTTYPVVNFTFTATDNTAVTHYLLTRTNTQPISTDSRWSTAAPVLHEHKTSGTHELYAWVKDAAGNVSAVVPAVSVQIDGIKVARNLYATLMGAPVIKNYRIDAGSGGLTEVQSLAGPQYELAMNPLGTFLYGASNDGLYVYSVAIDGALTPIQTVGLPSAKRGLVMRPNGQHVYVWEDANPVRELGLYLYSVNPGTGLLALGQSCVSDLQAASSSLPRHVAIHPNSNYMFLPMESIWMPYSLAPGGGFSELSGNQIGVVGIKYLEVHPRLPYSYGLISTGNIIRHAIGPGTMSAGSSLSVGAVPTRVAFHPSGAYAYVTYSSTNQVRAYAINQTTGDLTEIQQVTTQAGPDAIAVDDAGRLAFLAEIAVNRPNPDAAWNLSMRDPVDYGIDSMWSLFKADYRLYYQACEQVVYRMYGVCQIVAFNLLWPPAIAAATYGCQRGLVVGQKACEHTFLNKFNWVNSCTSPYLTVQQGIDWCNLLPPIGAVPPTLMYSNTEVFRSHFFIPVNRRWRQQGHWAWWDYI